MIRLWIMFFIFAGLLHFGIIGWRSITGKERWSLTKTAAYAILVALLAVGLMSLMVILF